MRVSARALVILFPSVACAFGCADVDELGNEDPKAPGEGLGLFDVSGAVAEDDCGAANLGAPDTWSFDVRLSRDGSTLYWLNGREAIVGEIDSSGRFSFDTELRKEVSPRRGAAKGCTVVRRDLAEGSLGASQRELDLSLSYGYSATSDSDCSALLSTAGMPNILPCALRYELAGARIGD